MMITKITNNGLAFPYKIFHIYSLLSPDFTYYVVFDYLQQRRSYRNLSIKTNYMEKIER